MIRPLSRCQSRSFSLARLSCCFLRLAGAHAFDFPAHEGDAGLEALLDEIIEARFAIDGDRRQFIGSFHVSSRILSGGAASAPSTVARSAWRMAWQVA